MMEELNNLKEKSTKISLKSYMEDIKSTIMYTSIFSGYIKNTKKWITVKSIRSEGLENNEVVTEYIFQDITALKVLERNRAREQCFDLLLATSSHDIRTPLNLILGVFDVLSDLVKTPTGMQQINLARCCGQKMLIYLKGLNYIRQIKFGTLSSEKILFDPMEVSFNGLVVKIIQSGLV